jgi:hypothetical protein
MIFNLFKCNIAFIFLAYQISWVQTLDERKREKGIVVWIKFVQEDNPLY